MVNKDREIVGILLAGGQSRRMGGGDKGLLDLGGQTMLARVIARVAPQVGALAINANGDPSRFAEYGLPVVADTVADFAGPLAGILSGMRYAAGNHPEARWILTVSTDAPFLPANLAGELKAAILDRPMAIAIARSHGHLHPVIGLWPVAHGDDLEAALADGIRKVLHWTDRHGTLAVDFADVEVGGAEVDPFFNANTPDELAVARRLIERRID